MKDQEIIEQIAKTGGFTGEVYTLFKGRVALYVILKAMGVSPGDEVIMPAYTCVVVPNAVLYFGAQPVYVDVNKETFNIDPTKSEAAITKNTRVVMAQNTFDLSSEIAGIRGIADKHGIAVVEDCAHGFGCNPKRGTACMRV